LIRDADFIRRQCDPRSAEVGPARGPSAADPYYGISVNDDGEIVRGKHPPRCPDGIFVAPFEQGEIGS
jgi:hypothetical protein